MENISTFCTNFGRVPCGQKATDVVKIENKTKKPQLLLVKKNRNKSENIVENLSVHPIQVLVQPKQSARFTLTYLANVEDLNENFCYDVLDVEECIAQLNAHAESVGPSISPQIFNLKFFRLKDVSQTSKNIEIVNKSECETKFYFDLDEDSKEIEISQKSGTLNANHKLVLKFSFNPCEQGVYYKKLFCLVQYHKPIIFNIMGIFQPKLKIEPKCLCIFYPPELYLPTGYGSFIERGRVENLSEADKIQYFQKRLKEERMALEASLQAALGDENPSDQPVEKQRWTETTSTEVFLTKTYLDVKNLPQVCCATALVNLSECQTYRYIWNKDPNDHFHVEPRQGFLEPGTISSFIVYFSPSVLDTLYHADFVVEIVPCIESEPPIIVLPLTLTLRIIGHSFSERCCWLTQCKITPQTLLLPSCVPNETVYGTFMIEREGHLPFSYEVLPPKEPNFIVQPKLGYLSKSFQLFVVEFSSESKEAGIYEEDLKIQFNASDINFGTLKIHCSVEKPMLLFGICNSFTFATVFPGSKLSENVPIENPTNLHLKYELKVPEDITWTEVVNPTGFINPKSCGEVEIIFKPESPCEYLDYIPCYVSSVSKTDYVETIYLQLIGSSQFGYLVALPSSHNFGQISYKETKTLKTVLFNFSLVTINFRLTPNGCFGDSIRNVKITPDRGCMPPKGSLEVEVTVTSLESDFVKFEINCQNFQGEGDNAEPCEPPQSILSIQYEGILPTFQIIDICFDNGGPLFSPDWAWKMFCVDEINAALKRVNLEEEIQVTLPEGMKDFGPLKLYILLEGSEFGDLSCESKLDIICPCRLSSRSPDNSSLGTAQCLHKKAVVLKQVELKSSPPKRYLLQLKINYSHESDLTIEISLSFPHNRTLTIVGTLTSLLDADIGCLSFYTKSDFNLKPVFIGDCHPPIQLFWVYNNTNSDAAYCLDVVALRRSTNVEGVFDCVNPTGDVPPFSSFPLGIVFKPNEIISYSVNAYLHMLEDETKVINLRGEGIVKVSPTTQYAIRKTRPRKTQIELEDFPLECYENTIDIPFLHVFSTEKRYFYIKNRSKSLYWAFRWHRFNVDDIFNAAVEPEEGVIEPSQDVFMTLILKSYSYQTFLSFSIPCDITNYSELKAYEKSVRLRDKIMEKAKDSFTITDKGISHETPDIPLSKKPNPSHIFLAVNVNIVSSLNIDQNLIQKQQSIMKAQSEMQNMPGDFNIKPEILPSIQEILEKITWHILCSNKVADNLKDLQTSSNYNYSHLLSESKTKAQESIKRLMALPDKNFIQGFLANQMTDMLCKNVISDSKDE